MGLLHDRKPDARVGERVALPGRTPGRIDLEPGNMAGGDGACHVVEAGVEIPDVRGDHVVDEQARGSTVGELSHECLGCYSVREGNGGVAWSRIRYIREEGHGGVAG